VALAILTAPLPRGELNYMDATEHFWNIIKVAQTSFNSIVRQLPTFDFMLITNYNKYKNITLCFLVVMSV
jgi:hypothetical protein